MDTIGFLVTWEVSDSIVGRDDGVRVRIAVSEACGIGPNVFAYRLLPLNANTGETAGHFDHVCSPVDLAEYPEEVPHPGASPPWFRLAFVDVLLRSWAEADNFVESVLSDLRRLKATLTRVQTLLPGGMEEIGTVCPESSSSSSESL